MHTISEAKPLKTTIHYAAEPASDRPQRFRSESVDPVTRRQMRTEAQRSARYDATLPPGAIPIPPDERIEPQPHDLYRPPEWLTKTATVAQVEELAGLLAELRELNREFAGERVKEVEVYFAATGLHRDLIDRFRVWCDGYVRRRADLANMNPRVGPHPFFLHQKVAEEVWRALGGLFNRERTLNVLILYEAVRYADWLGFELLWKGDLRHDGDGFLYCRGDVPGGERMAHFLADYADQGGFFDSGMAAFLDRVRSWAGRTCTSGTETGLLSGIASLAADIQAMRPLLVKNFRPEKTVLRLADDLWVAWSWQLANGIGNVLVARSEGELLAGIATRRVSEGYSVRHNGLLAYMRTPWRTAVELPGATPLAANYALLAWFRDRLFSFYDRIDLARVGAGPALPPIPEPAGDSSGGDEVRIAVTLSTTDSETACPTGEPLPNRRVPGIRFLRFERTLEQLGCEVRGAKGSEVSVYRHGYRKYVLGRHRTNREVFPAEIQRVLARLGLTTSEWLTALRG